MIIQEKMKEHVKEKCRYCSEEECDGIYITTKGETKCNKTKEV